MEWHENVTVSIVLAEECMVCIYKFGQRDTEWLHCHLRLNVFGVIPAVWNIPVGRSLSYGVGKKTLNGAF